MASNCVVVFYFPLGVCINVNFIQAYVTIGSSLTRVSSLHICKDTFTKEILVFDEPVHVAVGL